MPYRANQAIVLGAKRHWFKTFLWKTRIVLSYLMFNSLASRVKSNKLKKSYKSEYKSLFEHARKQGEAIRAAKRADERRMEEHTAALREYSKLLKECKDEGRKLPIPPPEFFGPPREILE